MRRLLLAVLLLAPATTRAEPARLGDFSLGLGPAFVLEQGQPGAGVVGEANLLWRWFSLGLHGRAAAVGDGFSPAAGIEASAFGLVGVGASVQRAGPSIDALLQVPIPIFAWQQSYLTVGWRPSYLLGDERGWIHEFAVQVKWSSLLVPTDD